MNAFQSLIQRKFVVLPHHATIKDAARAMKDNQIGCVLVTSAQGEAAGIVTDRDLALHWNSDTPLAERSIEELMSAELIACDESSGLNDVIRLMETHGVRRIPLLHRTKTGQARFAGFISLDDLIGAQLIEPSQLSRIVQKQIGRRLFDTLRPRPFSARGEARSEAHKSQSIQNFHRHLVSKTGLAEPTVPRISEFILGALYRRMSLTPAMRFLAQLPERVRDPILELPSGPDKSISPDKIREELVNRFDLSERDAAGLLQRFILALSSWMSPGQIDHLRSQLPGEFNYCFENVRSEKKAA